MDLNHLSPYKTINVNLHKIVRSEDFYSTLYQTAKRVDDIVTQGYEFLQIAVLTRGDQNNGYDEITEKFTRECLNTVCLPRHRPDAVKLNTIMRKHLGHGIRTVAGQEKLAFRVFLMELFYRVYNPGLEDYAPQLDRSMLQLILNSAARQMVTALTTNIHVHLYKHLKLYIDELFVAAGHFSVIEQNQQLNDAEKRTRTKTLRNIIKLIVGDLIREWKGEDLQSPEDFHDFVRVQRGLVLPSEVCRHNYVYHAKENPHHFLRGFIYMNHFLSERGVKTLVVFPMRNDGFPGYYNLNTTELNSLLGGTDQGRRRWNAVLDLNMRLFKSFRGKNDQPNYDFDCISTDGVSASVRFIRSDLALRHSFSVPNICRVFEKKKKETAEFLYLDKAMTDMSDEEKRQIRMMPIVAADPGMVPLLKMVNQSSCPARVLNTRLRRQNNRARKNGKPVFEENAVVDPVRGFKEKGSNVENAGPRNRQQKNQRQRQRARERERERRSSSSSTSTTISSISTVPAADGEQLAAPEPEQEPRQVQLQMQVTQNYRRKVLKSQRNATIRQELIVEFERDRGFALPLPPLPPLLDEYNEIIIQQNTWHNAGYGSQIYVETVAELQDSLQYYNTNSCDILQFAAYSRAKNFVRFQLREFYSNPMLRNLKRSTKIRQQVLESNIIKTFASKFDLPVGKAIVCFGDWSGIGQHMRHHEPVPNIGLKRMFRKHGYKVFLVREAYTSKRCASCEAPDSDCQPFRYTLDSRRFNSKNRLARSLGEQITKKLRYNLTRCNKCGMLWDRDVNGACNIWKIAKAAIDGHDRPAFL